MFLTDKLENYQPKSGYDVAMFCFPLYEPRKATILNWWLLKTAGQYSSDLINAQIVNTAISNSGGVPEKDLKSS